MLQAEREQIYIIQPAVEAVCNMTVSLGEKLFEHGQRECFRDGNTGIKGQTEEMTGGVKLNSTTRE